jgi:hypothetical protein
MVPVTLLLSILKLTCSVLVGLRFPPEIVMPPPNEAPGFGFVKVLPVKTMFSVALLVVAVCRWSPPAVVKVLFVMWAVTLAVPLGSMMTLSFDDPVPVNVEPVMAMLFAVPLEFLTRKLSSTLPEAASFVNEEVPVRPSKMMQPSREIVGVLEVDA